MKQLFKLRYIFIFLIEILIISIFVYKISSQEFRNNDTSSVPIAKSAFLPQEDYSKLSKELRFIVNQQNPKIALDKLSKVIATDSAVLRSCHVLTHEIGHEAYERYKNFGEVMKYKNEICNSGYMHGAIETHFYQSKDVFSDMKTLCSNYPHGKFLSWECYHGIGHGVMYYTSNDLPKSLAMCDSFNSSFARSNCSNGVFMENFNTDQKLHPSQFLDKNNLFYPCLQQNSDHKGDCYMYVPTFFLSMNKGEYTTALNWCERAEKNYQYACAYGVGSQAIKENINNPKIVETICENHSSFRNSCISGMVGLYINHFGRLREAIELCSQLNRSNKSVCEVVVEQSSRLF